MCQREKVENMSLAGSYKKVEKININSLEVQTVLTLDGAYAFFRRSESIGIAIIVQVERGSQFLDACPIIAA